MSTVLSEAKVINTKTFAKAFLAGSNKAYEAVTNPKEGTILTVIRLMGEAAVKIAQRTADFLAFFEKVIAKGNEALASTPSLLPVLEKAGVVDSGGQGLMYIVIGMYNVLAGIEMKAVEFVATDTNSAAQFTDVHDLEDIKFAYCTELFITNIKKFATLADIDKFRDKLTKMGDCVLVTGDLELVKVHVHTNRPDKVLAEALELGELLTPKIDNMLEQVRQLQEKKEAALVEEVKERKAVGLLAISSGGGFRDIFTQLNADWVLEGGQTMNPSVDDIVNRVNAINADNVIVLPNNKNIVLACEQAKSLVSCNLVVIATDNVPQGVVCAMAYDPTAEIADIERAMLSASAAVSCVSVTHAVKNAEIDGFKLRKGDIIAVERAIIAQGKEVDETVVAALNAHGMNDVCSVTLYYGEDVTEDEAAALSEKLTEQFPDCDVIVAFGGQAHYYYFISLE